MPGVLMIEAMAQVAGVLGFISKNVKPRDGYIYLFAGVDKVRFKRQVIPGDQLILRAKKTMERHSIYKFSCTACVGDELAASAEITIAEQRTQYHQS
jgi:3-hydroxyacyl-[acyl-carrier-protein] dehydratase